MATAWENMNLFERIIVRQGQMAGEREPYEDTFEDILDVFRPGLSDFEDRSDSDIRVRDHYNGTPASALRVQADGLQGNLVSQSLDWIRYQMPDQRLRGVDEVNKWLLACEEHMRPTYRRSGFYPALGPYFRGGVSVGTPVMISEEIPGEAKINCIVPHPRENFVRFDRQGVPYQYHRKYEMTVLQTIKELKDRNVSTDKLSAAMNTQIKAGNHGMKHWFLQVFYHKDDPIFEGVTGPGKDIKPSRPWISYVLEIGADTAKKKPLTATGYWARPHSVWRYETNSDEIYARTPAWHSLPDAMGLLAANKSLIELGNLSVNPRQLATKGMRSLIRRAAGSTTYKPTTEDTVEILKHGADYPIGDKERERMAANVERWFDVNFFLAINRLALSGGSPPTATQIIAMDGEKATLMAPRTERIINDALRPIDDRFWSIELNAGRLPQPPDIVLDPEFSSGQVDAEFVGVLAIAQRKASSVRRTLEGLGIAREFFDIWPELKHKIRGETSLEKTLEDIGFWQDAIVSKEEYAETLRQIAEKQRETEAAELGLAAADAIPKLGKAVEPNSPAAALVEAVA